MPEREQLSYTSADINQLITEVTAVIQTPPPEPIPPYEADNDTLPLFPEEAPTTAQRFQARLFIKGHLYDPVAEDTHRDKDIPAKLTPDALVTKHAAQMDYLAAVYPRTRPQYSLTHLLGAVKREYGRVVYLQQEEGRSAEDRIIYAYTAAIYQTMQNLVVVARQRAGRSRQLRL